MHCPAFEPVHPIPEVHYTDTMDAHNTKNNTHEDDLWDNIYGLVQDCSNSSALAMELLQSLYRSGM